MPSEVALNLEYSSLLSIFYSRIIRSVFLFGLVWWGVGKEPENWKGDENKVWAKGRHGQDETVVQLYSWLWGLCGNHTTGRFGAFTFCQLNSNPALDSSNGNLEKPTHDLAFSSGFRLGRLPMLPTLPGSRGKSSKRLGVFSSCKNKPNYLKMEYKEK